MIITLNLEDKVINYLDSVCGGQAGRTNYITNLLITDAQNQVQLYPEPVQSHPEINTTTRLHRLQKGFEHPEVPLVRRSGAVRKLRQEVILRRGER